MGITLMDHTSPEKRPTDWEAALSSQGIKAPVVAVCGPDARDAPSIPPASGTRLVLFLHAEAETRKSWIKKFQTCFPNHNASAWLVLVTTANHRAIELPKGYSKGKHGIYRLEWNPMTFTSDTREVPVFAAQILKFVKN